MNDIATFPYLARVEWEALDRAEMQDFTTFGPLPQGTSELRLQRTGDFSLEARATGEFHDTQAFKRFRNELQNSAGPGTISRGSVVESSSSWETTRIDGAFIHRDNTKVIDEGGRLTLKFELVVGVSRFQWEEKGKSAAWLTDWFLNGPRDFVWTRPSSRAAEIKYERRWRRHQDEAPKQFPGIRHEPGGIDHFYVQSPVGNFVVHEVPDELGPTWSKNIGIEYEVRSDGKFPEDDTRAAIGELLSFLFGRRMMQIGSTMFDANGRPVAVTARQPWGNNVRAVCEMDTLPPVRISRTHNGMNIETLVALLLPRFLELRASLRLSDALWRLWLGNEAALGISLPIYSAGLDMLASAWFKSTASKSKGVYLPKADFDRLLADAFKIASERLAKVAYGERVLRRMKNSFQTSVREATEWFFEEIHLPLGEHERAAMKARNAPAHGSDTGGSPDEIDALIRHGAAYSVLFERTVLKLLGYTGKYVDRRTAGFPLRDLDHPAGG